jgi:phosphatidylinositol alpha 1,6-mannosyltransferase
MGHAEFTGVLTGKDLSRAFANMDLFVFPSETDTFGLVVLEAFASGVPAVVRDAGGPKEIVQHGKTGYVAGNLEQFVAFTDSLLKEPEVLRSMGLAAREYALSTSWEKIFEGMYKAYAQCFYGATARESSARAPTTANAKYVTPATEESTVVS